MGKALERPERHEGGLPATAWLGRVLGDDKFVCLNVAMRKRLMVVVIGLPMASSRT
jgi:hypothetical protein